MISKEMFDEDGPLIVDDPSLGNEPTLRYIIESYYRSHDIFGEDKVDRFTNEYIEQFIEDRKEK